jgi:predicted Zn-dependent protease
VNLDRIASFLSRTDGVTDWVLHHQTSESTTVIRLPRIYQVTGGRLESAPNPHPREVIRAPGESVYASVYSAFEADGSTWLGDAASQLTGDGDDALRPVVESLVAGCRAQRNQPFPLPGTGETYPEVQLADATLQDLAQPALLELVQGWSDRIINATARHRDVAVSNLEVFVRRNNVRVRTSRGLDIAYPATRVDVEVCFLARPAEDKVGEHTARLGARRFSDLDPERIVTEYAEAARSIALAGPPESWQGPVVLQGEAAADFISLSHNPLSFHAGAMAVHAKSARYAKGEPISGSVPLKGEPLNLVSDPLIPFGFGSSRLSFSDACPCRRVTVVRAGRYDELLGARRYYHYLGLLDKGIAAPGMTGNTVVPAGSTPGAELAARDCVVVRAFSDFGVDAASGQFSVEVRLGERRTAGEATSFRGGLLVGNWFDAISDANYSTELQTYGDYYGPAAVRLNNLQVAG